SYVRIIILDRQEVITIPSKQIPTSIGWIDPKNDFAFYWLFGRKETRSILMNFLNALLKQKINSLDDITLSDIRLNPEKLRQKAARLDVKLTVPGQQINLEMQNRNQYNIQKRALFYWAKMYSDQPVGADYKKLPK
ncbi:MAG: Rpn family recombination-promoting nuclease/putative transposase, partial [Desulfotomaculum sp.]|nr:Rpn family recombination-promoting nuclease/putative transposase [Desulfotomaculum sp.]